MTTTLSPLRAALSVVLTVGLVMFLEPRIQASLIDGDGNPQWLTSLLVALPAVLLGIGWRQRRFERGSLLHAIAYGLVFTAIVSFARFLPYSPWVTLATCIALAGVVTAIFGNYFFRLLTPPPAA